MKNIIAFIILLSFVTASPIATNTTTNWIGTRMDVIRLFNDGLSETYSEVLDINGTNVQYRKQITMVRPIVDHVYSDAVHMIDMSYDDSQSSHTYINGIGGGTLGNTSDVTHTISDNANGIYNRALRLAIQEYFPEHYSRHFPSVQVAPAVAPQGNTNVQVAPVLKSTRRVVSLVVPAIEVPAIEEYILVAGVDELPSVQGGLEGQWLLLLVIIIIGQCSLSAVKKRF